MAQSYSLLGKYFEYLNRDCDYITWSQYLLNKLASSGKYLSGLDIGCGNGYFTRAFNKAGYKCDGVDISPEMLNEAKIIAAREGICCEFLLGDITKLNVLRKVGFCTAINDCINYVPPNDIEKAFRHVRAALLKGGVFLFDISTEYKIRNILGNNAFWDDGEDIFYLWTNRQSEEGVEMNLTFFVKETSGKYARSEETHIQYVHSADSILYALKEAGFTHTEYEEHPVDGKERLQFSAYV